jgi:hypothetical protein
MFTFLQTAVGLVWPRALTGDASMDETVPCGVRENAKEKKRRAKEQKGAKEWKIGRANA